MGKKLNAKINELRAKAVAGDASALSALGALTYVPPHLRTPDPLGALHRRMGTTFKRGMALTAKRLQPRETRDSVNIHPEYGFDRLQMLRARRERREARA